jgi:uncharacterized membrane protein
VLHLPIGLLAGLVAVEAVAVLRRAPETPGRQEVRSLLAWLFALSALVAAATGYILSREGTHRGSTVTLHQFLGFALAGAGVFLAAAYSRRGGSGSRLVGTRVGLAVVLALTTATGHFGGTLTHGADFLTAPLFTKGSDHSTGRPSRVAATQSNRPPQPASAADAEFERTVLPIFAARCLECHSDDTRRGGLALHTLAATLEGTGAGPVVIPGDAAASELVRRLKLPRDDDDHMPPPGRAPLTAEEVVAIEGWIGRMK